MRVSTWLAVAGFVSLVVTDVTGTPTAAQATDRVDVLILFESPPDGADQAFVRGLGGRIKYDYDIVPALAVNLPQSAVAALQNNPRVALVEPDAEVQAIGQAPDYAAELSAAWGVARIGAGVAHEAGLRGPGVKVAVIDTGMLYNHQDLIGQYYGGWDFVNNDADPLDDNGHGTRVSGVIAALRNGIGVVGVAPDVQIYALKTLNASGSGTTSNTIAAVDWAAANGMHVTNNSYGASAPSATASLAFANAAAAGIVHVAAAMNNGNCEGTGTNYGYPAGYRSVIAVAATDSADTRACFSSTGDEVEIAAPGVQINTTNFKGSWGSNNSGTSVASPHVAGAAAVFVGRGLLDANGNGRINDEIRNLLVGTVLDLGPAGRDPLYGFGLVDLAAALAAADAPPPLSVSVDRLSYGTAGAKAKDLKVTVGTVYGLAEPAGSTQVSITLVKNGVFYASATGTTDVHGLVTWTFRNAPSGTYTTTVTGVSAAGLAWDLVTPSNSFVK